MAQRPVDEIVEDMANLCVDIVDGVGCSISDIKSVGVGCPETVDNKSGIVKYLGEKIAKRVEAEENDLICRLQW